MNMQYNASIDESRPLAFPYSYAEHAPWPLPVSGIRHPSWRRDVSRRCAAMSRVVCMHVTPPRTLCTPQCSHSPRPARDDGAIIYSPLEEGGYMKYAGACIGPTWWPYMVWSA